MTMFRSVVLAVLLLIGGMGIGRAQAPETPPAGLTQQQFDALVEAISNSVTEKLKAQGMTASPPAPAAPAPAAKKSGKGNAAAAPKVVRTPLAERPIEEGPGAFAAFLHRAGAVAAAFPAYGARLTSIPGLLDQRAQGGRGTSAFLLLLGAVAVVAVLVEAALRALLARYRARLAAGAGAERGLASLGNLGLLAMLDGIGVLAVWVVCNGAAGAWFAGTTGQDRLAAAVLVGIFAWRLDVLLFRIILQPDMPAARLCKAEDREARPLYLRISAILLLIMLGTLLAKVLLAIGASADEIAAYRISVLPILLAAFLWLVLRSRIAARQWFGGLGGAARLAGAVGRHWVPSAVTFIVILALAQLYGAIEGQEKIGQTMLLTLGIVVGVLVFETFLQAFVRRLDSQLAGATPASAYPRLPDVVARCVRVAVLIGALIVIAESWVVRVLGLASESEWLAITRASRTAGITLFLAFVLWEFLKYVTDPYMAHRQKSAAQAIADGDATPPPASRITTMMPLLRMATAILIGVIAVMVALESFGINVTPLIAGASVFGIAISFGSQTLVRDIVSGIFYLTDDAFRVGEYVDCGKAKGTVEGFTIRSIKLRHQNGQLHIVPFGQLGQITNFSRDWITVKFNLRFARDTDLEKLRKAAKKIGQEMLEIPEIKEAVLTPFKMQGVADITENALLVRFKFTARPGNPGAIQREAVKRMYRTFPELGIEFAREPARVFLNTGPDAAPVSPPAPVAELKATA
ncbi:mechanosensitive ion channel family protein [Enhydrobacter sp.]|jgi:small-conductance mechanosensitive channel|uniref:mechanosensitive ion channel family protein n=1 Tax=Enhydrobacter sp. TaxID=1894999 RepID=UPI002606ABBC|nr:mechanosensitive ion channel family protein [Enhydrobacter sp.]WIM09172.1 MAG: Potassium efflux system KefA protein / Small-conductance mechanosensitive channel [Enhydrobacter sp.]